MTYTVVDEVPADQPRLRVAALMPCLNEESSIDATFTALLEGTRVPDEIIVADGGSTDKTLEMIAAWQDRGVPITVVDNPQVFAGAGRNRAAEVSKADVFVALDFGNGFDPDYVEQMALPFEMDASVAMVAGTFQPVSTTPFERCVAIIDYTKNVLVDRMTREERLAKAPKSSKLAPGMAVAWSREAYQRAGGQPEWLRAAEDVLFGHRILRQDPNIALQPVALVYHHMRDTLGGFYRMRYTYLIGRIRAGMFGRGYAMQLGQALAVLGAVLLSLWSVVFVPVALLGSGLYLVKNVLRPFWRVDGKWPSLADFGRGLAIALARDAAIIVGTLRGGWDWVFQPRWRRQRTAYLNAEMSAGDVSSPSPSPGSA